MAFRRRRWSAEAPRLPTRRFLRCGERGGLSGSGVSRETGSCGRERWRGAGPHALPLGRRADEPGPDSIRSPSVATSCGEFLGGLWDLVGSILAPRDRLGPVARAVRYGRVAGGLRWKVLGSGRRAKCAHRLDRSLLSGDEARPSPREQPRQDGGACGATCAADRFDDRATTERLIAGLTLRLSHKARSRALACRP